MMLYDRVKHELEARFPGWHVWYVRRHIGLDVWCARPRPPADDPDRLMAPLLNEESPEDLAEAIRGAARISPSA